MTNISELDRGQKAREILDNQVYVETMAQIRDEITNRWASEPDESKREHLWRMLQCHKRIETLIFDTMTTGKMAQKALEAEQTRKQKILGTFRRVA